MDWVLPDGDGAATIDRAAPGGRGNTNLGSPPRGEAAERVERKRSGVDDDLLKPFEVDEFAAAACSGQPVRGSVTMHPGSGLLDVHVSRLCDKLGGAAWVIETVHRAGIRLGGAR